MDFNAISLRDLRRYHHDRRKVAGARASRTLALVSAMFTRAIEFEFHPGTNLCFGIKCLPKESRGYVSEAEFREARDAAGAALHLVLFP